MRAPLLLAAFAIIAMAAVAAQAQPYRWVDEKGRVQYTDTLPPASAKNVEKVKLHENAIGRQPSYELSRATREAPIKLYTHPICKEPCQLARELLAKRGVPFAEVVASDPGKLAELQKLSGAADVPVLVVGDQVEKRLSAEAYDRALDGAGYPR
jgi:glutaredoxin